jgi:copper(I)-binding protein
MKNLFCLILLCALSACQGSSSNKQISISDAWARATVPGQVVGAAYLSIAAKQDIRLDAVTTPVAESVEIHTMQIQQGVMSMRMLEKLDIPAGKKVTLAPGQTHLMLIDLKSPLKAGENITLQLSFSHRDGSSQQQTIIAPVLAK